MHWFQREKYDKDVTIPPYMDQFQGPNGIAVVKVFDDGKTSKGWGADQFMENYEAHRFNTRIADIGAATGRWNFAFVMRSMSVVCIDIDGKNNGFESVGKLGLLPPTLAETSKSGNGHHLFYATPHDTWDKESGFAGLRDRVGLYEGIDIRAVGCVYHYPGQMWNYRSIADLPDFLWRKWTTQEEAALAEKEAIYSVLDSGDVTDILVMQDALETDLKKPIPAGRRNTTLFAIGVKLKAADHPDWEELIYLRGKALGLDIDETNKIISNVTKYG
jgi:hypothetical protein